MNVGSREVFEGNDVELDHGICISTRMTNGISSYALLNELLANNTNVLDYQMSILMKCSFLGKQDYAANYFGPKDGNVWEKWWGIGGYNGKTCIWWIGNRSQKSISGYANQWHKFTLDKNGLSVDGAKVSSLTPGTWTSSGSWANMAIGVVGAAHTNDDYALIKRAKVTDGNGNVVMNLIPTGEIGFNGSFLEEVSGKRFASSTTLPFEVVEYDGPNIKEIL